MRPSQPTTLSLNGLQLGVLIVAIVGTFITTIGAFTDTTSHFLHIYLVVFLLWAGVAIGCLGLLMLNNLVYARWMHALQRLAEAGASTLPLVLIFSVPIVLGSGALYPWAGVTLGGGNDAYLEPLWFGIRTIIYFAIWIGMAYLLVSNSAKLDEGEDPAIRERLRTYSALGMVVYVLTTSLASIDWSMSLTPDWFSSAWGWQSLARYSLTAITVLIMGLAWYWNHDEIKSYVNKRVTDDLAGILLVTTLLWAYLSGISFVVYWSGNVAFFAEWYQIRLVGSWETVTTLFIVLNAIVILLLLVPGLKGNRVAMVTLAAAVFGLRIFELFWIVVPTSAIAENGVVLQWWNIGPLFALGGFWLLAAMLLVERRPLVPANHPVFLQDEEPDAGFEKM